MGGLHITHGRDLNAYKIWLEKTKGKDHSEDLGVDGRIISEWVLRKWGGKAWTGFVCLRIGTNGGLL
jgi:hypothetical protein